jgi:hypothetical protein
MWTRYHCKGEKKRRKGEGKSEERKWMKGMDGEENNKRTWVSDQQCHAQCRPLSQIKLNAE